MRWSWEKSCTQDVEKRPSRCYWPVRGGNTRNEGPRPCHLVVDRFSGGGVMVDLHLIAGAVGISFLHALMPTHWASFVFVGKAQGWSQMKTLTVAAVSGCTHVLMTLGVGWAVVLVGRGLAAVVGGAVRPISGAILIVFGLAFMVVHFRHRHREEGPLPQKVFRDRWAIVSLISFLAFSPCQALIPIFFAASPVGWRLILPMSFLIGLTTLLTMLLMTYTLLHGLKVARFQILEDYEGIIAGMVVLVLGLLLFFHH